MHYHSAFDDTMKVDIGDIAAIDRRRPKRQRTPTTLYTDDNPSTFTVKVKKGEHVEPPPKPSFYFVEDSEDEPSTPSSKRPYRRRKPYHKDDMLETTTAQKLEALAIEQERQMTAEPAPPVKRKRGRPPKKKPPVLQSPVSASQEEQKPAAAKATPKNGALLATSSTTTAAPTAPNTTPPLHDMEGLFIPHALKVKGILPYQASSKTATNSDWAPLYQPNVYFDEDYRPEGGLKDEDLLPVTRSITCMTTRKPDHQYMAVGDTMGFCIIYSLGAIIRPVARLETVACQQRAREEQTRIRDQQKRKRKSLTIDTSQTTIHALGMIGERVVLATACELECMDVPSQTSLWVCPLAQDRIVTSLDMHPTRYDVLVSCRLFENVATLGQTSPLMLLQHSQNNVEVCDANAPILLRSPCCTAIWDNSKNVENRLLFVAVSGEELELILVQGGSIDNWKVACKTRIPVKHMNHATHLTQSPSGAFTMVACSRGIRLYQTETLQLINVYGDQLALHGQSVAWKECLMVGSKLSKHFSIQQGDTVQCKDWLKALEDEEADNEEESDLGQYVIGVPSKGPKELMETLHVWRVEEASVVPAISLPLPPKSEGVEALVVAPWKNRDRLVLATTEGDGFCLNPKTESDFAGIMYPPGYQVITDNVEYIEDEGELDHVIENHQANSEEEEDVDVLSEDMDDDLREAMRQSLLEQKRIKEQQSLKDEDVDVIPSLVDEQPSLIPCRPEAYLKQAVNSEPDEDYKESDEEQEDGSVTASPVKKQAARPSLDPKVFVSNILEALGHANPKKHEGGGDFSFSVTAKVVVASAPMPSVPNKINKHGKKSRAANLEAMIKASIDPKLQRFMFSRQAKASDGKGSSLQMCNRPSLAKNVTPSPDAAEIGDADDEKKEAPALGLLNTKMRQDETDVALGLLGLSPSPAASARVQTPDTDFASDTASRTSSQNLNSKAAEPHKNLNCPACRGRLVIHTCGTRALPIDFDEVAKQERLRRAKEEEEKKKLRAEKRRLADQRRREARKQKQRELEEQRRREEEQARLEAERIRRIEEATAAAAMAATLDTRRIEPQPSAAELERKRREMIVASYANHISHSHAAQPSLEMNSVDYNRRGYESAPAAAPATSPPPTTWQRVESAATAPAAAAPSLGASIPGSTSLGTLSSADALVALASFAGIKAEEQAPVANGQGGYSAFDRPATAAAAATHGFGNRVALTAPKRAIPSFDTLRRQTQDAATASTTPAASHSFLTAGRPGLSHLTASETNGTKAGTYVWPPPTGTEGVKWPPASS